MTSLGTPLEGAAAIFWEVFNISNYDNTEIGLNKYYYSIFIAFSIFAIGLTITLFWAVSIKNFFKGLGMLSEKSKN